MQNLVGHGTFGQVCKCVDLETGTDVAIKIIKNRPAYYNQAFLEIRILKLVRIVVNYRLVLVKTNIHSS